MAIEWLDVAYMVHPPSLKRILAMAAVLSLAALSWWYTQPITPHKNGANAQVPTVLVAPVTQGNAVEIFEALGTIKSIESLEVTPKISSYIKTIHATAGELVKAGEPIITLTAEERKADVAASSAQLEQAKAKRDDAAKMLARGEELAKQGFIAKARIDTLRADFKMAEQAVATLEAQGEMAQARLEDTILRAPFDGVMGIVDVQPGSFVNAGTKLTTLLRNDMMKVELSLPERAMPFLQAGLAATAAPIAQPDQPIAGTVEAVDSAINTATRQVRVNVALPNAGKALTQGMSVQVKINAVVRNSALLIPEEAVIGDGLRQFTFVVNAEGIVARTLIKTGVRTKGTIEVLEGLKPGDRVVTEGHQKIRHGQKVNSALK